MHLTSSGSKQTVWAFPSDRRKKRKKEKEKEKKPCIVGQSLYQLLRQAKPAVFTYFWCSRVTRTVLGTNFLRYLSVSCLLSCKSIERRSHSRFNKPQVPFKIHPHLPQRPTVELFRRSFIRPALARRGADAMFWSQRPEL